MARKKSIEQTYQKKTHREHILDRPDTYVGSTEKIESSMWIADPNKEEILIYKEDITYIPAFIKLYDEILTNASDHAIRTGKVTYIDIKIQKDIITITNDGPGIPVQKHKEEKIWIPELIFGHLLTSSNYDDAEQRIVGGRNGLGAKLTAVFSNEFKIKTADGKKQYSQTLEGNLEKIKRCRLGDSTENYTEISYSPDYSRFNIDGIDDSHLFLMYRRAIDVAAYLKTVNVIFNGKAIPILNKIEDYAALYNLPSEDIIADKLPNGWEYCLSMSDENSEQVSIVNGITTYNGGTHVNALSNDLVNKIKEKLERNRTVKITNNDIKNRLFLFLRCAIPNPTFNTQTKELLTSRINRNDIDISNTYINKVCKSEIVLKIQDWLDAKEKAAIASMNRNKTRKNKLNIKKLEDAKYAGTTKSKDCFLFLTEGDSAKASVLSGISKIGREFFGIFPLKGKIMNVRDEKVGKIIKNEELKNIFTILGLTPGKEAKMEDLRYGGLIAMTDSDSDGMHIRGLIINLFHYFWPNLLKDGFLYEMNLPLQVATKKNERKEFFSLNEYYIWKRKNESTGWKIKYYKGLGSLTGSDMVDYFSRIEKYLVQYDFDSDAEDLINISFDKSKSDERKDWLSEFNYEF